MDIILADDHVIFRDGLKLLLLSQPNMQVSAEFDNVQSLQTHVQNQQLPDIIILDYHMPGGDTLAAVEYLKTRFDSIKIIMLTGNQTTPVLQKLVASKADAVVLKEGSGAQMLNIIKQVQKGIRVITDQVQAMLNELAVELTTREFQVLTQLSQGSSSKDIGDLLSISPKTVDKHRENLMKKLQVKNVVQLVNEAHKLQLI